MTEILQAVLRMPIAVWSTSDLDQFQRQSRYVEAADLIESLQAKLEAAERDAARYRWLREGRAPNNRWPHVAQWPFSKKHDTSKVPQLHINQTYTPENLDAAIDAALKAKEPKT